MCGGRNGLNAIRGLPSTHRRAGGAEGKGICELSRWLFVQVLWRKPRARSFQMLPLFPNTTAPLIPRQVFPFH